MPSENKPARWKLILGYTAFSLVALVLCLFLTFPFDALRARVATEAARQGYAVRIGSLRPGFFAVTARDVQISQPPGGLSPEAFAALTSEDDSATAMMGAAVLGEPLMLDSVSVRPSLFPPGVSFTADAMGGTIQGSVGGLKDVSVKMVARGLQVNQGNLPAFSGLDMEGTVGANVLLTVPRGTGKDAEPDLAAADGEIALDTSGLVIKGGKVAIPLSPGSPPIPMDMPRIALGQVTGRMDIQKGLGTVRELRLKSEDLEAQAEGTLKLGKRLAYSEPALDLRLKADPAFTKRLGLLGAGLSMMAPDPKDASYRAGRLTGFLNRPQFSPPRR
jgi:type II secretion system protein N